MKKVFLACGIALSAIAFAATTSNSNKVTTYNKSTMDTVPKDTSRVPLPDTTKTPPAANFLKA